MERHPIPIDRFTARVHHIWSDSWFLLTSGNYQEGNFNTMTVAWGSIGYMWNKPFIQVVVRPTRYTYYFMEEYDTFTLCTFSEHHRDALKLLGSKSGRDGDKLAEAGLTAVASKKVQAPAFEEAELVLECRKIYWDDFDPIRFLDQSIHNEYPARDWHRIYFGKVLYIEGTDQYRF